MVETIHLAHMPPGMALFAALYTDVENAVFLKEQLLAGNSEFEYAFIDASMILSPKHALAAAFRAMNDYMNDRLKSHNVHSEIVFSLSSNNNIGEAFRRFGVSESTRHLLALKVATKPGITFDSVSGHLASNIQGKECSFEDVTFQKVADIDRIRKVYKIAAAGKSKNAVNGTTGDDVDVYKNMETQVLGLMALRGAT